MTIVKRNFVYRGRIKVSADDLRLAKVGKKTCTIRLGTIGVEGNVIDLTDGREKMRVRIVSIETDKRYSDLTDAHAHQEGFETLGELHSDLKKYYGNVEAAQPITIIAFEAAERLA